MYRALKTIAVAALLVSAAAATYSAETQDAAPMESPMLDAEGGMMSMMGMMEQMNEMMATCTQMMKGMMGGGFPGRFPGPGGVRSQAHKAYRVARQAAQRLCRVLIRELADGVAGDDAFDRVGGALAGNRAQKVSLLADHKDRFHDSGVAFGSTRRQREGFGSRVGIGNRDNA